MWRMRKEADGEELKCLKRKWSENNITSALVTVNCHVFFSMETCCMVHVRS